MKVTNITPITRMHLTKSADKIKVIHQVCCDGYGITLKESQSGKQDIPIVRSRQMAQLLSRELLGNECPYHIIGYVVGGDKVIDHATVRSNCRLLISYMEAKNPMGRYMNPDLRSEYDLCKKNAVLALAKINGETRLFHKSVKCTFEPETMTVLRKHCKEIDMPISKFIRSCILTEINRLQNGVHLF